MSKSKGRKHAVQSKAKTKDARTVGDYAAQTTGDGEHFTNKTDGHSVNKDFVGSSGETNPTPIVPGTTPNYVSGRTELKNVAGRSGGIILDPPIYRAYCQPAGWLTTNLECHALWHYYVTVSAVYKSEIEELKYEGDRNKLNLHQLYLSVAKLYGVDPNLMERYWPQVDLQARTLGIVVLPKGTVKGIYWRDPRKGLS